MPAPLPPSALARLEGSAPLFTAGVSVAALAALKESGLTPAGLVVGTAMHHIGFQPQRWNQSVELGVVTQAMLTARSLAVGRMEAEATALGAVGVVEVRLETISHEGAGDVLEFLATGTAVRGAPTDAPIFTTQLSGQELATLARVGYAPTTFAFGVCVYHVAHQTMRQALSPNVELPQYSQAFFDGRELAIARMQTQASEAGSSGVVGVEVVPSAHVWHHHAIEFLATGSAVRSI
ncbi:MAG: heavy metal-binding domain-containing protein [Acidimicrobiales bacterium]